MIRLEDSIWLCDMSDLTAAGVESMLKRYLDNGKSCRDDWVFHVELKFLRDHAERTKKCGHEGCFIRESDVAREYFRLQLLEDT